MPHISLQTIAEALNCSRMTVSRALRNDPKISAATRRRVHETAERLGYRPSPLVSTLMTEIRQHRTVNSSCNIAIINLFPDDPTMTASFWSGYREGIERRSERLGFNVDIVAPLTWDISPENLSRVLLSRGIIGLLVAPLYGGVGEYLRCLEWEHFAAAAIDPHPDMARVHGVRSSHRRNLTIGLREVERRGFQRVGMYLTGRPVYSSVDIFCSTYAWWTLSNSKPHIPPLVEEFPKHSPHLPTAGFRAWFTKYRPDVIFCQARDVLEWVTTLGAEVPKDVSLVHLNHAGDVADWAGVSRLHDQLGSAAVDLLYGQITRNERGVPEHQKTLVLEGAWRDGGTLRERADVA